MIYLQDPDVTIHCGNALDVLRELPDESVHMCCTSPPFYGLRDYGTGSWEGGNPDCDHVQRIETRPDVSNGKLTGTRGTQGATRRAFSFKASCGKCGATRVDQQIGLEPTPDEWVAALVGVFREVRRVLRSDGTCWIEVGDSYSGSGPSGASYQSATTRRRAEGDGRDGAFRVSPTLSDRGLTYAEKKPIPAPGTKAKDLIGAPWLLAFALRADGWYLRSEIIWAKPNPMPESVTDRPTTSHSRVFLLTKSGAPTYWTHEYEARPGTHTKPAPDYWWTEPDGPGVSHDPVEGWIRRNAWRGHDYFYDAEAIREPPSAHSVEWNKYRHPRNGVSPHAAHGSSRNEGRIQTDPSGRNRRSVWTIATQPYPEAHFATWPTRLVEPMILAGTSERGVCPGCGAPWERIIGQSGASNADNEVIADYDVPGLEKGTSADRVRRLDGKNYRHVRVDTGGWQPTCKCGGNDLGGSVGARTSHLVPATVLDPFGGSGTTAHVARKHGRRSILIELNETYCALAARRLAQLSLEFA